MTHGRTRGKAAPRKPAGAGKAATPPQAGDPEKSADTGQPPKIAGHAFRFGLDPALTARVQLVCEAGRRAGLATPDNIPAREARTAVAMLAIAEGPADDDTRSEAIDALDRSLLHLATAPSLTTDDVAMKLAGLVLELVRRADSGPLTENAPPLMLAASALADLTILRRGPIPPPPRGTNGEGGQ